MVYSIRLRRAWRRETVRAGEAVSFVRGFGKPTGVSATDRVFLVVARAIGPGRAVLNQESIGHWSDPQAGFRCDVTGRLQPRNQLQLQIDAPAGQSPAENHSGQPTTEEMEPASVWLEIHSGPPSEYDEAPPR